MSVQGEVVKLKSAREGGSAWKSESHHGRPGLTGTFWPAGRHAETNTATGRGNVRTRVVGEEGESQKTESGKINGK